MKTRCNGNSSAVNSPVSYGSVPVGLRAAQRLGSKLFLALCLVTSGARADETKTGDAQRPLSPADEASLAGHLQEVFEEGYVIGAHHLKEALQHLAEARRVAPGDPRVAYVHGLVLLKQVQTKPAVDQFDAAAKLDGGRYWPAWQAAIWGHLIEKQYDAGLARLAEYAKVVRTAEKSDEVSEAQRHAARWIGQLIEALSVGADSKKVHELLAAHEAQVLGAFGDELSEEVEAGRESVREREAALEQAAGEARRTSDRDKERRKKDKASKIDKDIEGLGKAKDDDKKNAEDWKAWLDATLAKADKQLGLLERDYNFLNQRAESLSQSIMLAGQEITALEGNLMMYRSNRSQGPAYNWNAQYQLQQRQNQFFGYQLDYNATVGRMQGVAQQGNLLSAQRAEAVARYETATGQLVKNDAAFDKWTTRLKDEKQKLTVAKPPAKGNKKVPAGHAHQFSLKSYVPLDFDAEKVHVLATFIPPEEQE